MTGANPPKRSKKSSDGNYSVGYGRPPEETRFKPGQSGNPKGRSKGSKNFSTHFEEELSQQVTLVENGKTPTHDQTASDRQTAHRIKRLATTPGRQLSSSTRSGARKASGGQQSIAQKFREAEEQLVMENIRRRIRLADGLGDRHPSRIPAGKPAG